MKESENIENKESLTEVKEAMILVHFVENWGKGISKILKLEPKTEFKELGRKFYTVFKRKTILIKSSEKSSEKVFSLLKENNNLTINDLSKHLEISTRGIEKILKKLSDEGVIKRIGGRKTCHLEILK